MAIERISMGKGTSISSEERDRLIYWFVRVKNEYNDRKAMRPTIMNVELSVQDGLGQTSLIHNDGTAVQ